MYAAIFLGLGVLGLYHYMPAPAAQLGGTFVMSHIADEAEKFCESPEACEEVCGDLVVDRLRRLSSHDDDDDDDERHASPEPYSPGVEYEHDMHKLAATSTAGMVLAFLVHLLELAALALCAGVHRS